MNKKRTAQPEILTKKQIIEAIWARKGLLHMENYKAAALEILNMYDEQISASIGQAMPQNEEIERAKKNFSTELFKQKAWLQGASWYVNRFLQAFKGA